MTTKRIVLIAVIVLALLAMVVAGFLWRRGYFAAARYAAIEAQTPQTLQVVSPAFADGAAIPTDHTCDGASLSVPLAWSNVPTGTQSFALISEDLDVSPNGFVHWVLFNIPATETRLSEGLPTDAVLPFGAIHGNNGANQSGYLGSCPPPGAPASSHRYVFKVYALGNILILKPGATKAELFDAMQGHLLSYGQTLGVYARK